MREIKFRAWDKKGKGFINGFNMYGFSTGQGALVKSLHRFSSEWSMDDVEFMQYTGLNDCKRTEKYREGQPIYEGDLCTDDYGDLYQILWSEKHQWACKLIKTNYTLSRGLTFSLWHYDSCKENGYSQLEVIGNIHQNPELLEVRNAE